MKLYGYFRSSAAYRVRIALNLKGLAPEATSLHLVKGQQRASDYLALNPQGLVPALVTDEGKVLTQSLAIIDWLEDTHPEPPLLPADPLGRARVRGLALAIACDIHPLNNLRVLKFLTGPLALSEAQKNLWATHWIATGFDALESLLPDHDGWCVGLTPTLADCCLVPQVANAQRIGFDLSPYPRIRRIDAFCQRHAAFAAALPSVQPDFIPS